MPGPASSSAGAFHERAGSPPPLPDQSSWGCATPAQVGRLATVAALRPLGFGVAELDRLLAILEEIDDGLAASDRCGRLLDELERFCNRVKRFAPAPDLSAGQALAALHRRHDELAATVRRIPR